MGVKSLLKNTNKLKYLCATWFLKIDNGILPCMLGCLGPALLPPIHIATLYYFWQEFSRHVDQRYCSCSCWDTVFKGTYESGIASYKHIYFNATFNTLKIWILTVFSIIVFYESVRRLVLLGLQNCLRYSMLILFTSAIFSHYYSWWSYWNYWNDDYYIQWNHQLFFTSTELVSTFIVLQLADFNRPVTSRKALLIVGIAVLHVIAGSLDQFVQNVLKGEGYTHQVLRDINFMIPDVLHVILPLFEFKRSYSRNVKYPNVISLDIKKDLIIITSLISFGLLLCSFL